MLLSYEWKCKKCPMVSPCSVFFNKIVFVFFKAIKMQFYWIVFYSPEVLFKQENKRAEWKKIRFGVLVCSVRWANGNINACLSVIVSDGLPIRMKTKLCLMKALTSSVPSEECQTVPPPSLHHYSDLTRLGADRYSPIPDRA